MLWRHLKTKVKLCIVERALRDFQLNWHNSWWWLRLLSFRTILAAFVWSRSKQRSRRQTCRLPRFSWRSKEELLITRALFAGTSTLLRYLHEFFILLLKLLCILEYYCSLLSNNEIHCKSFRRLPSAPSYKRRCQGEDISLKNGSQQVVISP